MDLARLEVVYDRLCEGLREMKATAAGRNFVQPRAYECGFTTDDCKFIQECLVLANIGEFMDRNGAMLHGHTDFLEVATCSVPGKKCPEGV